MSDMSWRNTLILAVIALAGVAYFRFFEMKRPSTEEARQQAQNVVTASRSPARSTRKMVINALNSGADAT